MGRVTDGSEFDSLQEHRSLFANDTSAIRASHAPRRSTSVGLKRPESEADQLLVSSVDVEN